MQGKRISREKVCVETMIRMYCKEKHRTNKAICEGCQLLLDYALRRLQHCKFGEHKPVCLKCPSHCYSPNMRKEIGDVMRFAGPRMVFKHPQMALLHLIDSFDYFPKFFVKNKPSK